MHSTYGRVVKVCQDRRFTNPYKCSVGGRLSANNNGVLTIVCLGLGAAEFLEDTCVGVGVCEDDDNDDEDDDEVPSCNLCAASRKTCSSVDKAVGTATEEGEGGADGVTKETVAAVVVNRRAVSSILRLLFPVIDGELLYLVVAVAAAAVVNRKRVA